MATRVLVSGAGGFIGHHLVRHLARKGDVVCGVDIKFPEYEASAAAKFELLDLRYLENALIATRGMDEVYHLGADQTRSFMYVEDCVEGIYRIMRSDYPHPLNLGTEELVTINQLADLVAGAAGKRIVKRHDLTGPQGVRGRNSDNTKLRGVLTWEPRTPLREGLPPTYRWIDSQLRKAGRIPEPIPSRI